MLLQQSTPVARGTQRHAGLVGKNWRPFCHGTQPSGQSMHSQYQASSLIPFRAQGHIVQLVHVQPMQRHRVRVHAGLGFGSKEKKPKLCPCGSGMQYKACCQPYHDSADGTFRVQPPSAEACLRARMAAFALKSHQRLIIKTTALDNPVRGGSTSKDGKVHSSYENDIKATFSWMDVQGLKVLNVVNETPDRTIITFQIQSRQLFELETGNPIKNAPWKTVQETACFVREPDAGWVLSKTQASNWDKDKLELVA